MKADSENKTQGEPGGPGIDRGPPPKQADPGVGGGWDYSYPVILTPLREKLIKTSAKVIRHARHITFQLAEVVLPRNLFEVIFQKIDRLLLLPGKDGGKGGADHGI